ncbi:hypothetical protein ACHAWF_012549 [Thalassiosira exigua]
MASPIKFNVGGRHFEVSRELIEQQPESMVRRMVSESWPPDPKQVIFIDRNGDIFAQGSGAGVSTIWKHCAPNQRSQRNVCP